jgi:adenylate cyclase
MGQDEPGTLARIKVLRRELIDPKIAEHKGRIVKTTRNGILIEFSSVVEAVSAAVAAQRKIAERNVVIPRDNRIEFRIGIDLGDVVVEDGDIFGDGVNLPAKLESLAEHGGICVSRVVRDQVRDKLTVSFEDMGEQRVKNFKRPVHAYRVTVNKLYAIGSTPTEAIPPQEVVRPFAVLPFNNVSGISEREYFVDSLTEDIITALSKWRWFLVIARNSTLPTRRSRSV